MATQIVMLGTGTPYPDPDRSGPATAIVVDDTPYLIDFGPGVIRRVAAAYQNGVTAFGRSAVNIKTVFLTHLHSDHTMGYPDLIFTPWIMGRTGPLTAYGPPGFKAMTDNILKAWQIDINARAARLQNSDSYRVDTHEIAPGVIYRDRNVAVTAFPVNHHEMKDSFGFRFETPDRTIVISGDTTPTDALIDNARGCDVLIHEAYSLASYGKLTSAWQEFRRTHHTSSKELAVIAERVKPGLLILYHRSNAGGDENGSDDEAELVGEIRQFYKGNVMTGRDLEVF
jgi:ribonuclease BN (tRNA processing enzyme)